MVRRKSVPAQIKIRLPDALRRDLEREARNNGRTLNGEIVYRLTEPFVQADRQAVAKAAANQALDEFVKDLGRLPDSAEATHRGRIRVATDPGGEGDPINPKRESDATDPKRESDNG
jgi:hypothetical protein